MKRRLRRLPAHVNQDLAASLLVFLVALPLCLGIAVASGASAAQGLISGIIGGLVVGSLSGSALQVSGPAAGLTVIVAGLIHDLGPWALGPAVLAAGLLQMAGGMLGGGRLMRLFAPAVIEAMLAAIGLGIVASQLHVALDLRPAASVLRNLASLPGGIATGSAAAAAVAAVSLGLTLVWERAARGRARVVPAALVGVTGGTLLGLALSALHLGAISRVSLPGSLVQAISPPWAGGGAGVAALLSLKGAEIVVTLAIIASLESLLSAAAVQRIAGRRGRADFDQELVAQGVGNVVAGLCGALPVTGVIVRSAANTGAGARTRLSAVLHGVWLLGFVETLPAVLRLVPNAALAGVLLLVGARLMSPAHLRAAWRAGHLPAFAATFALAGGINLLAGVAAGVAITQAQDALARRRAAGRA